MSENETAKQYEFDSEEEFLDKLDELINDGVPTRDIETLTPFHVHDVEHKLNSKPSALRFIALAGALSGFLGAFALMIFTVIDWPLMIAGNP